MSQTTQISTIDQVDPNLLVLLKNYTSILMISDSTVNELHGNTLLKFLKSKKMNIFSMVIPNSEKGKTLDIAKECWDQMLKNGLDRKSCIIGLGGGSITDLAGFVASCYMRGIDTTLIPTTLLGMVDAAIGGKTAVNFAGQKNIIGTFHKPKSVILNIDYLNTLSERDFCSGMAEVIKYGVIWNKALFDYLEKNIDCLKDPSTLKNIIDWCVSIKTEIVEQDEKDKGIRSLLNYGHTFAHAIESLNSFSTFSHGEAVSIGMTLAAQVAHTMGFVDHSFIDRQRSLCQKIGLPTELPNLTIDQLIPLMKKDKKSESQRLTLVLPKEIGRASIIKNIDEKILKETFNPHMPKEARHQIL